MDGVKVNKTVNNEYGTMSKTPKILKTLYGKLSDLDDHLYLLNEALNKLASGEPAYLKSLAAELRVLVCLSSGTEGLLWRLVDKLGVHDAVYVHLAGNVNKNLPLATRLNLAFVPIFRAGEGDPRLPPAHYSLRDIIKKIEAIFISGHGYTHEQVIKAVAQQIGSAHEDERVDYYLVEISELLINNQPSIITILTSDAELVYEVGERVIQMASQNLEFFRKSRTSFVLQATPPLNEESDDEHFEISPPELPLEGTIMFLINHSDRDWRTNSLGYSFGQFKKGPLAVLPTKHPDGTIELTMAGFTNHPIVTRQVIPASVQTGVMVAITWKNKELLVYLNGQLVDSINFEIA